MPDDGNLDPSCSRLHHDEYETNGGLIAHLQLLNSQSNGEVRAEFRCDKAQEHCCSKDIWGTSGTDETEMGLKKC